MVRRTQLHYFIVLLLILPVLAFSQGSPKLSLEITNSDNLKMKQKISQDTRLLAKKNTPIYVSAPVNGKIPIYSDVAIFESSQCKPPCKQLGELEANTPLTVTGEVRTFEATDGKGGLPALLSYIEVQFESAGELKKGWILSDSVSKKIRQNCAKTI